MDGGTFSFRFSSHPEPPPLLGAFSKQSGASPLGHVLDPGPKARTTSAFPRLLRVPGFQLADVLSVRRNARHPPARQLFTGTLHGGTTDERAPESESRFSSSRAD